MPLRGNEREGKKTPQSSSSTNADTDTIDVFVSYSKMCVFWSTANKKGIEQTAWNSSGRASN